MSALVKASTPTKVNRQGRPKTFSAYIRIVSTPKHDRPYCYAVLTWDRGKMSKSLGTYPYLSSTAILDAAINAAMQSDTLTEEELARLLVADKSYRPFKFTWSHYEAFRASLPTHVRVAYSNPRPTIAPPAKMPSIPLTVQPSRRKLRGLVVAAQDHLKVRQSVPSTVHAAKVPKRVGLLDRFIDWLAARS